MILSEENEVYITSNKTLFRFDQKWWIYNWKGLVWFIVNNENAKKILMGHNFEHLHRFETEPSIKVIESTIS